MTNVSCSLPTSVSLIPPTTSNNWTIQASLNGCAVSQSIDSTSALSQYGVEPVPQCSSGQIADPFAPVFFWFYNAPSTGGTPVASAVLCKPTIAAYAVEAAVDSATQLLLSVNVTGNVNSNNVTGESFAGKAFNG